MLQNALCGEQIGAAVILRLAVALQYTPEWDLLLAQSSHECSFVL